jgi:hypothetical protein
MLFLIPIDLPALLNPINLRHKSPPPQSPGKYRQRTKKEQEMADLKKRKQKDDSLAKKI